MIPDSFRFMGVTLSQVKDSVQQDNNLRRNNTNNNNANHNQHNAFMIQNQGQNSPQHNNSPTGMNRSVNYTQLSLVGQLDWSGLSGYTALSTLWRGWDEVLLTQQVLEVILHGVKVLLDVDLE